MRKGPLIEMFQTPCALVLVLSLSASAQPLVPATPVVSGGAIYQAAAAVGIAYIVPTVGQAIVNDKAAINWKTLSGSVASDVSIGTIGADVARVFTLSQPWLLALVGLHAFYDQAIAPIIAGQAPNPNAVAPVLQITGSMAPSAGACAENTMYATPSMKPKHGKFPAARPLPGPIMVGGLQVTFTPQSVQVLRNISGSKISQFQVIDVVACVPLAAATVPAAANVVGPFPHCWQDPTTNTRLCQNMDGLIFRPDIPAGGPNVVGPPPRGARLVDPDLFLVDDPKVEELIQRRPEDRAQAIDWRGLPTTALPSLAAVVVAPTRQDARISYAAGKGFLDGGKYSAAALEFSSAVALDPAYPEAWNALGFSHYLLREYDLALGAFDAAVAAKLQQDGSWYQNALHNRALARQRIGDRAGAARDRDLEELASIR